ncbi:hypothetical protein [Dyadobacter sp. BHUBP1]|uniref:hypothetical protein n=1 Tax=Dyadobacter sp. BHUBP1 TaxID=3424178 RepID=UPI003D34D73D
MEERIAELEKRVNMLENTVEELFFSLASQRTSRRSIELIVELAVLEHFQADRRKFHTMDFGKFGDASTIPEEDKRVLEARKWFMSIMRNMLHHNSWSMKKNYPWYHHKKEVAHRAAFIGAINPTNPDDESNRLIFKSICISVQKMCLQEGIAAGDLFIQ